MKCTHTFDSVLRKLDVSIGPKETRDKMKELTFEQVTKIITRDVMEQYEQVRVIGCCNMLSTECVCNIAERLEFNALMETYKEHFVLIWQNFSKLMAYYEIEQ